MYKSPQKLRVNLKELTICIYVYNAIIHYKYIQGFYRHLKLCGVRKERQTFQYTTCFKSFEFRCRLKNHMDTPCKLNAPVNTGKVGKVRQYNIEKAVIL